MFYIQILYHIWGRKNHLSPTKGWLEYGPTTSFYKRKILSPLFAWVNWGTARLMVCFRRGCQTSAVNMDFNTIWRKISICEHKPRRHFLGRVLNDLSCSHHAVLWPPSDATWLLPHHVQGAASLHLEHSSKPRAFPFLFSLCSPPPSRVLACPSGVVGAFGAGRTAWLAGLPHSFTTEGETLVTSNPGKGGRRGGQKTKAVLPNSNYS